jgi:amino acid adenylation domain-containing protein
VTQPHGVTARLTAVVAAHPDVVAVVDGDARVTYTDLLAEAGRIADLLPDDAAPLVGIQLERGWRAVAAMIAVLSRGRAYVPIDPAYPPSRREYLYADSAIGHVVVDDDTAGVVVRSLPGPEPARVAVVAVVAADAMYVIYTSGSTGDPKGVVVTHDNVLALLDSAADVVPARPGRRWSVFHSFSFDFSVWELWAPLLSGGTAVLVGREAALDPKLVVDLLRRERVQVLSVVPSVFTGLLRGVGAGLPELEQIVFGGEAIRVTDVEQWWRGGAAPACELVNMYGITETTVHVTAYPLTPQLLAGTEPGRTPIGKPLPHLTVRLSTDGGATFCPPGRPGEMIVSGGGVAAGYLGRPDLTAARFPVVDGERAYLSGDWAVADADGRLYYVGRVDDQVKIRGHRVELGEVENVLARHAGVAEAACVVHREPGRVDRLVGFVVAGEQDLDPRAVRRWLTGHVPSHMVPSRIFVVGALSLTASGKLDRGALAGQVGALFADLVR